MQTLKIPIPVPDGFEIDSLDKSSKIVTLKSKPQKVTDRIKTFDDVLTELNMPRGVNRPFVETTDEYAYVQLKLIAKALNEGWEPNWDDNNEYKYYPWFYMDGGSSGFRFYDCDYWYSSSYVGSRLCYKSRELAEYAGKQFLSVYREFMVIKK